MIGNAQTYSLNHAASIQEREWECAPLNFVSHMKRQPHQPLLIAWLRVNGCFGEIGCWHATIAQPVKVVAIPALLLKRDVLGAALLNGGLVRHVLVINVDHGQLIHTGSADRLVYLAAMIPGTLRLFERINMRLVDIGVVSLPVMAVKSGIAAHAVASADEVKAIFQVLISLSTTRT